MSSRKDSTDPGGKTNPKTKKKRSGSPQSTKGIRLNRIILRSELIDELPERYDAADEFIRQLEQFHDLLALGPSTRRIQNFYLIDNVFAALQNHARGIIIEPSRNPKTKKEMDALRRERKKRTNGKAKTKGKS